MVNQDYVRRCIEEALKFGSHLIHSRTRQRSSRQLRLGADADADADVEPRRGDACGLHPRTSNGIAAEMRSVSARQGTGLGSNRGDSRVDEVLSMPMHLNADALRGTKRGHVDEGGRSMVVVGSECTFESSIARLSEPVRMRGCNVTRPQVRVPTSSNDR